MACLEIILAIKIIIPLVILLWYRDKMETINKVQVLHYSVDNNNNHNKELLIYLVKTKTKVRIRIRIKTKIKVVFSETLKINNNLNNNLNNNQQDYLVIILHNKDNLQYSVDNHNNQLSQLNRHNQYNKEVHKIIRIKIN